MTDSTLLGIWIIVVLVVITAFQTQSLDRIQKKLDKLEISLIEQCKAP